MNKCASQHPSSLIITIRFLVAVYVTMHNKNILAYFSDFSLKAERLFFFFCCKEEGIHIKVIDLISVSLSTAIERLSVCGWRNKMPLKQTKNKNKTTKYWHGLIQTDQSDGLGWDLRISNIEYTTQIIFIICQIWKTLN